MALEKKIVKPAIPQLNIHIDDRHTNPELQVQGLDYN